MSSKYLLIGIIVAFAATFLTRVIPFVLFANKKPGKTLRYIEIYLPVMIMIILVFYALRDVKFSIYPFGLPEIIGIILAVCVHLVARQALLSIVIATGAYMYIIQFIV